MRMEIWISQTLMVIYSSCWPWLRPPILALFRVPRPSRLQYGTAKITVFVTGGSKVSLESPALLSHLDALWLSMSPFPLLQSVLEVALMTLKTLVQCPTDRSRSIQQAKVTKLRLLSRYSSDPSFGQHGLIDWHGRLLYYGHSVCFSHPSSQLSKLNYSGCEWIGTITVC